MWDVFFEDSIIMGFNFLFSLLFNCREGFNYLKFFLKCEGNNFRLKLVIKWDDNNYKYFYRDYKYRFVKYKISKRFEIIIKIEFF